MAAMGACLVAGGGCAHGEEPSFYEQMLSGVPEDGDTSRPIAPELWLSCGNPGAEVLLDGILQGLCSDFMGKGIPLADGPHQLEVRQSGYLPYVATVEAGRARMTLNVDLVRLR